MQHLYSENQGSKLVKAGVLKYGVSAFNFTVLHEGNKEEMYELEKVLIKDTIVPRGYNIAPGGFGGSAPGANAGEKNTKAKLTEKNVLRIRNILRETPEHLLSRVMGELAKEYGVIHKTIRNIVTHRTWRSIGGYCIEKLPGDCSVQRKPPATREEKIALFMHRKGTEDTYEKMSRIFGWSQGTIHKYVKEGELLSRY